MFMGNPDQILIAVEDPAPTPEEEQAAAEAQAAKDAQEFDPLASSEEEIVEVIKINLKEIDRLLFTVLAIENDCHILPQGSMKLTESHEVARNAAFKGLGQNEFCKLECYSHFRNV